MTPELALQTLKDGNQLYIKAIEDSADLNTPIALRDVGLGQQPFAIVLSCSDSRVPAELIFNCGIGELFVIRVAGNIASPTQIGSIEYACQHLGAQLVVVMGHSHCGAVSATIGTLSDPDHDLSPNLESIIDQITPAVRPVVEADQVTAKTDNESLLDKAVRANVTYTVSNLSAQSEVLSTLIAEKKLAVVGAEYALETGKVSFHE